MKQFASNESGASLVEYGLLVGLISVVAIVAVTNLGTKVNGIFNRVVNALNTAGL